MSSSDAIYQAILDDTSDLTTGVAVMKQEGDTFFLMWASVLVFFMQSGFGMLEAGSVRSKNTKNILLKNILDACLGCLVWYIWGYGLAYGDDDDNSFIGSGSSGFAPHYADWDEEYTAAGYDWVSWFFQYTFAAAAATIVSGGVAERAQLGAYLAYTVIITGFVYPIVVHWMWDSQGFLSTFNNGESGVRPVLGGAMDFAGSCVVHMTGGIAAFLGAMTLGPRIGKFDSEGKPQTMAGHNSVLQVLGTFILWVGWYGFNCGSTLGIWVGHYSRDMARVSVTTTLAASSGGTVCCFLTYGLTHIWDVGATINGILAGLVSITAGCVVVDPWAAIIIGGLGGLFEYGMSYAVLNVFKVDDPLDAFAVHGISGFWATISVGLFCSEHYSFHNPETGDPGFGIFMGAGENNGQMFGAQLVAVLITISWAAITSGSMFTILKIAGLLRISAEVEELGMDVSKHGGSAYDSHFATSSK